MNEKLGHVIKEYRKKAGLSKAGLARAIGVDRGLITRWEGDITLNLSLPILIAIMDECGVDVNITFVEREPSR